MKQPAQPQQPTLWEATPAAPRILRVSDLNRRVRALLDGDTALADVWVEGEISQPSLPPSGHCFFTLKDGASQIRAVMFREELGRSVIKPTHGMQVIIHGRVRAYEPQGIYQLYAYEITPAGAGDLHAQYEALRAKLAAEGLFEPGRKRPLPRWPRRIGVVTSPIGAVWRDIANVRRRCYPMVELLLSPSVVQGPTAAPAIVRGLQRLYAQRDLDLVILARGGGSLEDLWPFNDERVVRCVVAAPIPVVVGVGHESDVTLADFAADVRAPTPSAAAELAVPDASQLLSVLGRLRERATTALTSRAADRRRLLIAEERALAARAPNLEAARQHAAELVDRGHRALLTRVQHHQATLTGLRDALRALGPAATLERGYAVARLPDGAIVRSPEQAPVGAELEVVVAKGSLATRVERIGHDERDQLL